METESLRRQNKACLTCKRRKVRCDSSNSSPCTPCTKLGIDCLANPQWIRSNVGRRTQQRQIQARRTPSRSRSSRTEVRESSTSVARASLSTAASTATTAASTATPADTLSRFLERGIAPVDWAVFAGTDPVRIAYIGTDIANLNRLVRDEQPLQHAHHFPFPQFGPLLPWKPTSDQLAGRGILQGLSDELSSFPTKAVRDSLVETYFTMVHPGFPVIDECDFRTAYEDPENPPPLLLFHSVLLVGAHVSDHPLVAASRAMVMATLFRRAKVLFDIRHENDRQYLVQSSLLLAWHVENSDSVSANSYYWIGIACRVAFGLGMHRDLSLNSEGLMPIRDRRIYRKIFWCLFQAEIYSALEHGRPCMIRNEDFDQPPLDDSDFEEEETGQSENVKKDFCHLNIALASLGLDVIRLKAPKPRQDCHDTDILELDRRLAALGLKIPLIHDFWSCQLRINYNLILLLLYRDGRQCQSSLENNSESSDRLSAQAASTILLTFETMIANNTIRQCQPTCATALMAATIQLSQDVKHAISRCAHVSALSIHGQLERLVNVAKAVADYWPNAEAIARLCQSFCDRYTMMIKSSLETSPVIGTELLEANDFPWQDLLSDSYTPHFAQFLQQNEWMSTSSAL